MSTAAAVRRSALTGRRPRWGPVTASSCRCCSTRRNGSMRRCSVAALLTNDSRRPCAATGPASHTTESAGLIRRRSGSGDTDRRNSRQALSHNAITLSQLGKLGQGRVVGIGLQLGDDTYVLHAYRYVTVDAERAAGVEHAGSAQLGAADVDTHCGG